MKKLLVYISVFLVAVSCGKEGQDNGSGEGGGGTTTTPVTYTISGTVKGNDGLALQDVVVSDGLHCVKTDSQGKYRLPADLSTTRYVFVSTPSGYAAPVVDGHACFWKFLKDCTKGSDGKYDIPFTLKKVSNPERYTVFIFADPQPRKNTAGADKIAYQSLSLCEDMYRDMKELASTIKGRQVYGIGLGDIVHQDLTLLPIYRQGMATTGFSTYVVIGNHDQEHKMEVEDAEASKGFEALMGPVNYSFNLGGMHYLMLDNMISPGPGTGKYSDECITGLREDIWEWVKNDLSFVPTTTPLMVCAHSPMCHLETGSDRQGPFLADLRAYLAKYPRAYVWAGHSHSTYNYASSSTTLESHTLSRVTGELWANEYLGANGTPRGYIVFDYDNGSVSWKFKPMYYQTGAFVGAKQPAYEYRDWDYQNGVAMMRDSGKPLDDKYQMQVFAPGLYEPNYIYANIFMWDEQWKTPTLTVNGDVVTMKRVTTKDLQYSYSDWEIKDFYINNNSFIKANWSLDYNNCKTMFRGFTEYAHGSGTVSVKDRFGNTHSSTITW
ncbi:MAG: calcineurin-like phosphoesterase C-terminal domain-containing protein [Bacteroidales bacterium]|nr:calcineurin-like phosphoesterase C-terminal domain-containing protein [Bacteroidales bacterium]